MTDQHPHVVCSEARVSSLVGDRLCTRCGYNLTGQAVLREPHYNMLIVRCPECATVASLQEYPLLGRWANRWAAVLAGVWLLVMLGAVLAVAGILCGFSIGSAETAGQRYVAFIGKEYEIYRQQLMAQSGNAAAGAGWNQNEYIAWRDQQDFVAMFARAGGWSGAVDWNVLLVWVPYAMIVFAFGCFWSVAMITHRVGWRLLAATLMIALATFFAFVFGYLEWQQQSMWGWWWGEARSKIGVPALIASLVFGSVVLLLGMAIGRRVARGLVCLLLPPRMRHSLAFLWIADQLPLPSASSQLRR